MQQSKEPQKITKELIDRLSDFFDEKGSRDPKGMILEVSDKSLPESEELFDELYLYAHKKGIIIEITNDKKEGI